MKEEHWNVYHCTVEQETAKAILVEIDGQQMWLPKSQLDEGWPDLGDVGEVGMTDWIAGEKGLL